MIQEFRVTNFMSFRDETVLSFEPVGKGHKGKEHDNEADRLMYPASTKTKLLRLAIFYGANASGKSNMLQAIRFLVNFCKKKSALPAEPTGVTPFLLNRASKNLPSKFSLKFFINGIRYWYTLSLDTSKVFSEALYYYKTSQPINLFKRIDNQLEFNPAENTLSGTAKELLELNCFQNLPFFASKTKVNIKLKHIDRVGEYFEKSFMDSDIPQETLFSAAEQLIAESHEAKNHILHLLKEADFNISDISSKKEEIPVPEDVRNSLLSNSSIPEKMKESLRLRSSYDRVKTLFTHHVEENGRFREFDFPSQSQSLGTRRLLALESFLFSMEESDRISAIDEVDTSLHPSLVDLIMSKFARHSGASQLIVSTHYTGLLDNPDLRDDCFWITQKDPSGASSIHSVGKIRDLRLTSKEKGYRSGRLGGIPIIKTPAEDHSFSPDFELSLFD